MRRRCVSEGRSVYAKHFDGYGFIEAGRECNAEDVRKSTGSVITRVSAREIMLGYDIKIFTKIKENEIYFIGSALQLLS